MSEHDFQVEVLERIARIDAQLKEAVCWMVDTEGNCVGKKED